MKIIVVMLSIFFSSIIMASPTDNPGLNNAITIDVVDWLTNLNFRKRISEKDFVVLVASVNKTDSTIQHSDDSACGYGADTNSIRLDVGNRRYISQDMVVVFFESKLVLGYDDSSIDNCISSGDSKRNYKAKTIGAGISFGGEYFINKNISVEGKLNLIGRYIKTSGDRFGSQKLIENNTTNLLLNYYF